MAVSFPEMSAVSPEMFAVFRIAADGGIFLDRQTSVN
jgi:hypothetical protein